MITYSPILPPLNYNGLLFRLPVKHQFPKKFGFPFYIILHYKVGKILRVSLKNLESKLVWMLKEWTKVAQNT